MTVEPTATGNTGTAARDDIENRPTCSTPRDNKRIWEGAAYSDPGTAHDFSEDRFTLYGLDGQRVGIYRIRNRMSPPDTSINMRFVTMEENVWVGKKLLKTRKGTTTEVVLQDRLGSVLFRYNVATRAKKAYAYYPYGQSRGINTPDNEDGFGTYTRPDNNENHYADQRYYNAKNGRFHQPDPYQASGGPTDPASWNRYTYVVGDPVNLVDPSGLQAESAPLDPAIPMIFYCQMFPLSALCLPTTSNGPLDQPESAYGAGGGIKIDKILTDENDAKVKEARGAFNALRERVKSDKSCLDWLGSGKWGAGANVDFFLSTTSIAVAKTFYRNGSTDYQTSAVAGSNVADILISGSGTFYYEAPSL